MSRLEVRVKDNAKTVDKLTTYKRWFNGLKFFFTVKVLPKKQK